MTEPEHITVEEAAAATGLTTRQIHRYGETGRLKRRRTGKRYLYDAADVAQLAADLGIANRPPPEPRPPRPELVPAGELLTYIRERDAQLERYQRELFRLAGELAEARAAAAGQKALTDQADSQARRLEEQLAAVEQEREALRKRVQELESRRPWWRRLLGD